jgi:hypothetical protein
VSETAFNCHGVEWFGGDKCWYCEETGKIQDQIIHDLLHDAVIQMIVPTDTLERVVKIVEASKVANVG